MCLLYFSNKKDKVIANRLFRRISRLKLKKGEESLNSIREVSDTWNFDSDGLAYYFPKQYYNYLLNLGYSQEDIENKSLMKLFYLVNAKTLPSFGARKFFSRCR